ncbi:hypothetical protein [Streptomyces sp. MUM 2J]|uniref:Rv1733c family protein n=1 Tax=Streptomyces sp. MUM 2J TaxID=2791987 RepID=UPI001F04D632|nr:hypothetical protein [Streptomyces sp. MUM 2J]MCH0562272.1 hypothetical protein [Streptomyces sp. MUM 2J]
MRGTRVKRRLWRWRSNPLRRHDDVVEAWVVLVVWLVIAVGGTLVGLLAAHATDEALARQRTERYPVQAVLVTDSQRAAIGDSSSGDRVTAKVRWTAPDGITHTGYALVDSGQKAGAHVVVWLDARGALAHEPPSPAEAALESALFGGAAALALAGVALGCGAMVRWRLDRRRIDAWGREWDVVEPRWGHRTG